MKAKVLIIGPAYPLRGGLATYNERLARAFIERGYEVKILTFSLQYPKILFPGKTQVSTSKAPEDLSIDVGINSISPFNWWKIGNEYASHHYDYVIFRYWMPFMAPALGTIARRIKKNGKSKCIAITDNVIPHEKRLGDQWLTQYFVKSMDAFLTMSRSVLKDLENLKVTQPRVYQPHPLYDDFGPAIPKEEAKRALGLDTNVHYILFFGFIRDYKGLDLLLKAFSASDFGSKEVKLLVAGEFYTDSKKYLDLIEELNLSSQLELHTDFIPNEKVPLYFSACDLVAQTYKNATQSGVTQIAYFYEKPMIVTSVGGLAELVLHERVGFVVQVDAQDISHHLTKYFNQNLEKEFSMNMKTEKARFSWDQMVDRLTGLT